MTQTRFIGSLPRLLDTEIVEVIQKKKKKPKKQISVGRSSGYRVIRKYILDWE